jgi:hypothetical protein
MREWNPDDRAMLFPAENAVGDLPQEIMNDTTMKALMAASDAMREKGEKEEIRFYQKGESLVALRLSHRKPGAGAMNPIGGMAMNIVAGNMEAMSGKEGFAVVKGVPYRRELGLFSMGGEDDSTRVLTARMGEEIRISVRARASDEEVYELLNAIDYDTLNAMLATPLAGVGRDAPEIPLAQQKAVADALISEQSDALIRKGRESEGALQDLGETLSGRSNGGDAQSDQGLATKDILAALQGNVTAGKLSQDAFERIADELEAKMQGDAAAASPTETVAAPGTGGGMKNLAGFISGIFAGDPVAAGVSNEMVASDAPAQVSSDVKVNRSAGGGLGAGTCTTEGAFKRCTVGD